MGFFLALLKVVHYVGLFMGGGSAFGAMVIGMTAPGVPREHAPTLVALAKRFKVISHIALALLIGTGIIMAALEGVWGLPWFWVKLAAVAVLIVGIVMAGKAGAKALQGDPQAGARAEKFGMLNHVALLVVLIAAVAAFH